MNYLSERALQKALDARQFLDIEARASDENSTDEEDESDLLGGQYVSP